jgi:hypothetical protein
LLYTWTAWNWEPPLWASPGSWDDSVIGWDWGSHELFAPAGFEPWSSWSPIKFPSIISMSHHAWPLPIFLLLLSSVWTQGFELAKQVLYCLSHISSLFTHLILYVVVPYDWKVEVSWVTIALYQEDMGEEDLGVWVSRSQVECGHLRMWLCLWMGYVWAGEERWGKHSLTAISMKCHFLGDLRQ